MSGTELRIGGGSFTNEVVAGSYTTAQNTIIGGIGTNLVIKGGTFNGNVIAGNTGAGTSTIAGGTHTTITNGTFNTTVYGGSTGAKSTIMGGVDISITGGTFGSGSKVYALGSAGTVNGAVNLTIGNNAKFASNSVISAGANGSVNYSGVTSSTVMLTDLTDTSSLAKDSSIKVMGGQKGSTLNMRAVQGTVNAQLSQFSHMAVSWASNLTLTQLTNEALGGVSSVTIYNASTLTLQNNAGQTWDLSNIALSTGGGGLGTLKKTGAGKLTIDASGEFYGGALSVLQGELSLSGAAAAKYLTVASGATLSVKEGDLFAGTNAGSDITIQSGATLAANEGNWTLNKAATVNGVTITGTHEVSFGSEVNSDAVVTMSGTINATGGHLVVKNGATSGETTLKGHFTIENTIKNGGALTIADGSYIGINEESLKNCLLSDGKDHFSEGQNGFLYADTLVLASGGTGITLQGTQTLRFNGEDDSGLGLEVKDGQLLMHMHSEAATEYFVNEGPKSYTEIASHATTEGKTMDKIAIAGGTLNLDTALAEGVTILAATDHASVSVGSGIELYAGQTAVVAEGSVNELHVTGEGSVRIDAASAGKLSQLAGDATMKVDTNTTFSSEAKMTGELNVASGDLTVTDEGTIASFSSVNLADNTTLAIETTHNDAIQSLSGSGKLSKTGEGTLAISDASSAFSGSVNIGEGTLEVQNNMTAKTLSGSGKLVKTGEDTTLTVQNASGFTGDISVSDKAHVNLLGVREGVNVSLNELVIDNGTLGVYVGDTPGAGENEANVGVLTLTGGSRIVVGGKGGTLEANLTTECDSILDFTSGGVLTMGCDLTVGEDTIVLLNESAYATLAEGGSVTLFSGVDNDAMKASNVSVYLNTVGSEDKMLAQVSFSSENGSVSVSVVPEPATATLSLLALAGLAARRRRSKAVAA